MWLRKSHQKLVSKRSLAQSHRKVGGGKGGCPWLFTIDSFCSQPKQKMETNLGCKSVKHILEDQYVQDGNPGDYPVILTERRIGDLAGLQRCVFPHSNQPKVKEVSAVLPEPSDLPIYCSSLWVGHSSPRVYKGGQRSETDGSSSNIPRPSWCFAAIWDG